MICKRRFFDRSGFMWQYAMVTKIIEIIRANAEKRRIALPYILKTGELSVDDLARIAFQEIPTPLYQRTSGRCIGEFKPGYHPKARSVLSALSVGNFSIKAFDTIAAVFQCTPCQLADPSWNAKSQPIRQQETTVSVVSENIRKRRSVLSNEEGLEEIYWISLVWDAFGDTISEEQADKIRISLWSARKKNFRLDKLDLLCQVLRCEPCQLLDPGWDGQ